MDKKRYASAVINSNYKANVWMIVAACLLLSNVLLSIFVILADTSEKTIVVPPGLEKSFSVKGDVASPEYLEEMSKYFSQQLLTYHKQNVESQFDTVLLHTDPAVYSQMKTRFMLDAERIARHDISSVFFLMGIHIKNNMAILTGEQLGMIGSQIVNKNQKNYQLMFNYRGGKLTLTGFSELEKNAMGELAVRQSEDEMLIEPSEKTSLNNGVNNEIISP